MEVLYYPIYDLSYILWSLSNFYMIHPSFFFYPNEILDYVQVYGYVYNFTMNYHVYMSTKPFRFVEVINSIILFIYLKKIYDLWHNKKRLQGRNVTPKNSIMRSRHGVTI